MYFVNGAEKLHYVVDVYHRLIFCLNKKVPKSISGPKAAMAYKASATQFEKIISVLDAANIATKEDVMGGDARALLAKRNAQLEMIIQEEMQKTHTNSNSSYRL